MEKQEILFWLNNTLRNKKGRIDSNKIKNEKYKPYIDAISSLIPLPLTLQQKIYLLDNDWDTLQKCYCGKDCIWVEGHHTYSKYCGTKCAMNDPVVQEKRKKTNKEKYGDEVATRNTEVKAKREKTNLERYGVATPFEMTNFKEKAKKTLLSNFGVDNPQKSEIIKERTKLTNIERYGSTSPLHGTLASKIKQVMIEKYGVEYALQNKELFNKFQDTMLERYETIHALQNKEIFNQFITTIEEKYGEANLHHVLEFIEKSTQTRHKSTYGSLVSGERTNNKVIPLFLFKGYTGIEASYKWKCVECGNEFEDHLQDGHIPRCKKCYPNITSVSSYEKEIVSLLESWKISNIKSSVRDIISPYELDIYLPDFHLAIEFHGLYWHSEISGGKDRKYHLYKYNLCKDKDIDLIQIFEDEWNLKKDIVINLIRNRLGLSSVKFFARKLEVREVPIKEQREFLDSYHIQGYSPAFEALGLYDGANLISLATFAHSRYNKNIKWELLRFVTKSDCQVVGGLSRLLKHFISRYPEGLISYCDKRLFSGKGYEAVGFTKVKDSNPNYYYMLDYTERYSRIQFQKHKLQEKLKSFDATKTEFENMQMNGYDRIWDAGMMVYTLCSKVE